MEGPFEALPGADLVSLGLVDLAAGRRDRRGIAALARERPAALLRVPIVEPLPDADRELYRLLAAREGTAAHASYNALTRRLVSFMHAAEHHAP